jgi:hypothetical protein
VLEKRSHKTMSELAAKLSLEAPARAFRLTRQQTAE